LLDFDAWNLENRRRLDISKSKRADCPCCGHRRFEFLEGGGGDSATLCGQNAVQVTAARGGEIDLAQLVQRWRGLGEVCSTKFFARCVTGGLALTVFADGRGIVRG